MKLLVTGGAGFIGSCFVRLTIAEDPSAEIVNLDALTYAGNLENLAPVAGHERYNFIKGNICDEQLVSTILADQKPDAIVHFAAESHVDRSILSPEPVIRTNLYGTFNLLECARRYGIRRFVHVSTDEVYGSLEPPANADESFPLRPSSPYSASKAGSDLLALSYFTTYHLPVLVTRASNNYGPYQFPEKLIPLMICNALEDRPLPVYGDGEQIRDWLYVEDHCRAIRSVLDGGMEGEIYNIGGNCSLPNLDVVKEILKQTGRPGDLITYVKDRPGHDRRYALSSEHLERTTRWRPRTDFACGLRDTINWYRENTAWIQRVRSGEYTRFYDQNYGERHRNVSALAQRLPVE